MTGRGPPLRRRISLLGQESAATQKSGQMIILLIIFTHVGSSKQSKEFPAWNKIHDHIEIGSVLKRAPEVDDERMLHALEHHLLVIRMLDLLHLHDPFLVQDLDRVEAEIVFASN